MILTEEEERGDERKRVDDVARRQLLPPRHVLAAARHEYSAARHVECKKREEGGEVGASPRWDAECGERVRAPMFYTQLELGRTCICELQDLRRLT